MMMLAQVGSPFLQTLSGELCLSRALICLLLVDGAGLGGEDGHHAIWGGITCFILSCLYLWKGLVTDSGRASANSLSLLRVATYLTTKE